MHKSGQSKFDKNCKVKERCEYEQRCIGIAKRGNAVWFLKRNRIVISTIHRDFSISLRDLRSDAYYHNNITLVI